VPYYMGDYYAGDPGFLSFVGRALKTVGGFIPGVGPAIEAAGGALAKVGAPKALPAAAGVAATKLGKLTTAAKGMVLKHPVLTGAGAAGVIGAAGALGGAALEKRMLRGGRRHRRMRVTNPKALRRALRRAYGFERLAMRTIKLLHPHKRARFGGFKRRRRAA